VILHLVNTSYLYDHRTPAGSGHTPAPVSYGGTSLVTILAGFGLLMSIHTHRKLLLP